MKPDIDERILRAFKLLAEHIELCPYCEYKVSKEVMEVLEHEFLPSPVDG